MKSLSVLLLTTVMSASSLAHAGVLNTKDWAANLDKALKGGKAADVSRQLDISRIEGDTLALEDVKTRQLMLRARTAYKAGKYSDAIDLYDQVPKGSDAWLESIEEKGWAYLRLDNTDRALAQAKTLLNPTFAPIVGSEPFLLQSLAQLKICDYKEILKTTKTFKDSQRTRLVEIQNLADGKPSVAMSKVLGKVNQFPIPFTQIGEEAKVLPRLFHRDRELQKAVLRIKMAEAGLPVLRSAQESGTKFGTLVNSSIARLEANAKNAQGMIAARLKKLAQTEVNDSFRVIQKLNLVEVETIQRVHTDQELDANAYSRGKFKKANSDQMVFPDDGHPWIDEVDKYQVQVNACPTDVRRKM